MQGPICNSPFETIPCLLLGFKKALVRVGQRLKYDTKEFRQRDNHQVTRKLSATDACNGSQAKQRHTTGKGAKREAKGGEHSEWSARLNSI